MFHAIKALFLKGFQLKDFAVEMIIKRNVTFMFEARCAGVIWLDVAVRFQYLKAFPYWEERRATSVEASTNWLLAQLVDGLTPPPIVFA